MSLYDDARALGLVSIRDGGGPYGLLSQIDVMGLQVVSMQTAMSFYGVESGGGGPGPSEGELTRVYPGMVRVYPGIVRVYPI